MIIAACAKKVFHYFIFFGNCLKFFESANEKDLAKKIFELYHSPEKRREMADNAFKRFESVRWENVQEEYLNIYRNPGL